MELPAAKSYHIESMSGEQQLRETIVEAGRRLYAKGYLAGADGNISARLDENRLLVTPSGVCKGFMKPEDLIITDMAGRPLTPNGAPTSELKMHLLIYAQRPEVAAVVHAHPPVATGYSAAGIAPDSPVVAEGILTLGKIALAPYGTPGTAEVTDGMRAHVRESDAILMANHGAVTCGPDVEKALFKMETLEHIAEINLVTEVLGRKSEISRENLQKLLALRASLVKKPAPQPQPEPQTRLAEIIAQTVAEVVADSRA